MRKNGFQIINTKVRDIGQEGEDTKKELVREGDIFETQSPTV